MPHLRYISENPYAQYFLGLEEFTEEPLFDASMMVHCRKRFSAEVIEEINQAIFLAEAKAAVEEEPEDSGSTSKSPDAKPDVATSLSLSPHGFSLTLPGGLLFLVMLPHSRYQPLW